MTRIFISSYTTVLREDGYNLIENLGFLLVLETGIALVRAGRPPPPVLDVVGGHEVGAPGHRAGDACSEAVSRDGVLLVVTDVRQQGAEGGVEGGWCEKFARGEAEDRI